MMAERGRSHSPLKKVLSGLVLKLKTPRLGLLEDGPPSAHSWAPSQVLRWGGQFIMWGPPLERWVKIFFIGTRGCRGLISWVFI